jgi:oxygen-independent coproporphyrinogen-3 oxidase
MPPKAISDILHTVNQRFGLMHNAEITLEANPGTVTQDNLTGYRNSGINRLSLGLQTCHDKQLVNLGRLHDRQEGLDAFDLARVAGFDNISLDLMFALPGQTKEELESDLNDYLELDPEHLSCYGLTAEFETPFYKQVISGEMSLPDADFYADAFMRVHDKLSQNGYDH